MVLLLLNVTSPPNATLLQRFLACIIICLGFIPLFLYVSQRQTGIPFLPTVGVLYGIYFALPVFTLEDFMFRGHGTEEGITTALIVSFVGLSCLLLGFYLTPLRFTRLFPETTLDLNQQKARIVAVVLGCVGAPILVLVVGLSVSSGISSILSLLAQWPTLAIAILYVLELRGELPLPLRLFLWVILIPISIIVGLGSGLLSIPMKAVLVLLWLNWAVRKRTPVKAVFVCFLIFFLFQGVKNDFRESVWYGSEQKIGAVEKGWTFISLLSDRITGDYEKTIQTSTEQTAKRTALLQTLAAVVESTPDTIPYWGGETYIPLLVSPIPRLIWPDKPSMTLGQDFGHRYDLIDDDDLQTSANLPQMVELYANFGWLGIIIGMLLLGVFYRVLYAMINHPQQGSGGILFACMIFYNLILIEADLGLSLASLMQTVIPYYVLFRYISNRGLRRKGKQPLESLTIPLRFTTGPKRT